MKYISLLLVLPTILWGQTPESNAATLGVLTLIPPALAIVLAFITRQVVVSLFVGLWSGAILLGQVNGFSLFELFNSFTLVPKTIVSSINSSFSAGIIMQVITIGGLVAVIGRNGGAKAVASKIASYAKTSRSAQLLSWVMGMFIFFEDYANALIVGSVMRPVTDKLKVSREKLAFIADATAAPVAAMALISTWIGFELSTIRTGYEIIGQPDTNVYSVFLETIPYRFYNILMIVFVFLVAITQRDFGPMLKAERLAKRGIINKDESTSAEAAFFDSKEGIPYKMRNALVPLSVLIITAIGGFWVEGQRSLMIKNPAAFDTLQGYDLIIEVLGASSASFVIFQAALIATLVAFVMGVTTKALSFTEALATWTHGAKNIFGTAGLTLILAWSISSIVKQLGTNYYLVNLLDGVINPGLLPMIIFGMGMVISFSTGTSYGTMGILMPLAIPLAHSLSGNDPLIMIASTGAVLAGAVFGDHCSPISDTTILSATGSGCPMLEHTETQLPYALLVGGLSLVATLVSVLFKLPVIPIYVISIAIMWATLRFYGKKASDGEKI